jgi:RIO kinase 1
MVKVWAEKEMKNLIRLNMARIPSPTPVYLKANVLMMDFIGKDGW